MKLTTLRMSSLYMLHIGKSLVIDKISINGPDQWRGLLDLGVRDPLIHTSHYLNTDYAFLWR